MHQAKTTASAVCTMFEGDYHFGLAALVNSLHAHGFSGSVWAGYRGSLPPWAKPLAQDSTGSCFQVADGLNIRFRQLTTKHHLTNYKPDFMLDLWEHHCPGAQALFYFDPDIVVRCPWSYFETWARAGVALCEDVNSPLSRSHPLRFQWNEIYSRNGYPLQFRGDQYINGGFQGITHENKDFLRAWLLVQDIMGKEIGGLHKINKDVGGRDHAFSKTDQDALNIAIAITKQPISVIGKEGMDFASGGFTMSHSIGHRKPWNSNLLVESIRGHAPSTAGKFHFANVETPIHPYSPMRLKKKRLELRIASALGRFYHRT
ncbi:MAG: hypothetical protein ABSH48_10725 [Verrucomicrobiota bacterium]|jgi:hypothetical protein